MCQMCAAFHYALVYGLLHAQNQHLASQGFTVLSVNYRGGPGYGVKFRAANTSGWQGASEYQDVLAGATWLQGQPTVDPDRVGIYGLSYGGLNAMQGLTRNSDVFAAGVANAPVFNWVTQSRFERDAAPFEAARRRNGGFRTLPVGPRSDLAGPRWLAQSQANLELAWESSPAGHLDKLASPLLVIQGDSDANVDFQETAGIVAGLRARGFSNGHDGGSQRAARVCPLRQPPRCRQPHRGVHAAPPPEPLGSVFTDACPTKHLFLP